MTDDNKPDGDDSHRRSGSGRNAKALDGNAGPRWLNHLHSLGNRFGNGGATKIMLVQGEDAPDANGPANGTAEATECADRIKALYPHVDEDEFPLPRVWSTQDKCTSIGLTENNLRAHYKGIGKTHSDAASVRTAHPIPTACGLYYFEVKIISKGRDGYMGIGLTSQQFKLSRLPGWDKHSFGYHGDDGNTFCSSGNGQPYGPTFTTGDVIGCGVNMVNNTCFYTKNGHHLGTAFRDLPAKLYPTVGLQTPGEVVDANFGQDPFKFNINDMVGEMRTLTQASIYDGPLPDGHSDWSNVMHKLVSSYLVHHGYTETAMCFAQTTNTCLAENEDSIRNRQRIIKLVMNGQMGKAIDLTLRFYPGMLESNLNLLFTLKCRQFVEMVNGADFQTTDVQLSKTHTNGDNSSALAPNASTTTCSTASLSCTTTQMPSNRSECQSITTTTQTMDDDYLNGDALIGHNSGSNGSNLTVDDLKSRNRTISNSAGGSNTLAIDYAISDVEMENNGHNTANGNGHKNNNGVTMAADEDMLDLDPSRSDKKVERILEFGRELFQLSQQLEVEQGINESNRKMLEDAFSLLAYSNPCSSPLSWLLCTSRREPVCSALNSAILESLNFAWRPPLETCIAHSSELLRLMACSSIGTCAFAGVEDVLHSTSPLN